MRPSSRLRPARVLPLTLLLTGLLCACASPRGTPDNEPTLATLKGRSLTLASAPAVDTSEAQAIQAYSEFLQAAPQARERAQAMRRLGDLEMDRADRGSADAAQDPDYGAALTRYQDFLKAYPTDPSNDRVLYQLARAYDQVGQLELELHTLDRLVQDYPATPLRDEAQFRRGELLFSARNYAGAQAAYATVLRTGATSPYHERALYMQGWSQFKQAQLDEALRSFFGVLDVKLGGRSDEGALDTLAGLSRAERELVEDTFRVTSLSLSQLQGADSIAAHIDSPRRQAYESRVYEQLGELYLKQERVKDAADSFSLFARKNPTHAQAPVLQARVIAIYESNGFAKLALDAKKDYVAHYGSAGEFRRANPKGWEAAQPLVRTHVAQLAQHYHASAQQSHASADYQEAVHWYRSYLESFPTDPQAAHSRFLLAELLFEDGRFAQAGVEYEKTAYDYPAHARSADAGYAALLSLARQLAQAPDEAPALQRASVHSALRFADRFALDPRAAPVLADAADTLYRLHDMEQASVVAQRVLDLQPGAAQAQRRVAWTVLAHSAFERRAFDQAERAYTQVLLLTPENDGARAELVQRAAAAVYQQGEQARAAGQWRQAVAHFNRVGVVAQNSPVHATAQYDAAAVLLTLKDWEGAARLLEDWRQRFPQHALQAQVGPKLALAYIEQGQWAKAAAETQGIAATHSDPELARDALWQTAELYEKALDSAQAQKAYERFLARFPQPLATALEARWRLARMAREAGLPKREFALMQEIYTAELNGGAARTDRTRTLGAAAALALAAPVADAYRKVALTEPLQKQLKLKKARLQEALKAYEVASGYGVAEVSTAATFHTAQLYRDFGQALMTSQRPKKLKKLELEQYNVMLEEQAFPFEEQAAQWHELNAHRTRDGVYDAWVKRSLDALRELLPARWAKSERSAAAAPTPTLAELEQAAATTPPAPGAWNRLGVAYREAGRFELARKTYESALERDPTDAVVMLNLAILYDLYLDQGARALELYQRSLALTPAGDAQLSKWITELKNRKPAAPAAKEKP